jgi:RHS repeat-associated protein
MRSASTETSTYGLTDNRLASSTSWDYQYDANGNQTAELISGGSDGTLFAYGERNRLETVKDRTGAVETTLADYAYNNLGQRVSKATTGETRQFVYDRNGQLIAEADAIGSPLKEYLYLDGRLVGVVEHTSGSLAEVIMDNTDPGTSQTGTWTVKTDAQQYGTDYLLAKKNTSATFRWTPTLTAGTYEVYGWWVARNNYNSSVTYTIAHDGTTDQVVKSHKQDGGQWVLLGTYTFSGSGSEYVEVADQGGNSVADAMRFQEVATSSETLYFVHTDHLGTPQAITDGSQQVVWQADYAPFGAVTETVSTIENPIRFPGQYADEESRMHYNYLRDYEPSIGRYVQSDPIGLGGGLNAYAYVEGNPVSYTDQLGLKPGDLFATPDDAMRDALVWVRTDPKLLRMVEYGGWIYEVDECFTYNATSSLHRTKVANILQARPDDPIGSWHYHPNMTGYAVDQFSDDDKHFSDLFGPHHLLTGTGNIHYRTKSGEESKVSTGDAERCGCE